MLRAWTELLPLFIHRFLWKRLEVQRIGEIAVVEIRPGIYVDVTAIGR